MPQIRQHDRYFSDGHHNHPLHRLAREPVVALHEAVPPSELGLAEYQFAQVPVRTSTFSALRRAERVHREVRCLLPYGAGNRLADVEYTEGESWARNLVGMTSSRRQYQHPIQDAQACVPFQAGVCHEHAVVAYARLASETINAPVRFQSDAQSDHGFVLIGDHRDPQWGERDSVIVDAYVAYPSACTLAQANQLYQPGMSLVERGPQQAPDPDASFLRVHYQGTDTINRQLSRSHYPPIGQRLLTQVRAHVAQHNPYSGLRTAARDPSTGYRSEDVVTSETTDRLTRSAVRRQQVAYQISD